jgi:hypothetical protein
LTMFARQVFPTPDGKRKVPLTITPVAFSIESACALGAFSIASLKPAWRHPARS